MERLGQILPAILRKRGLYDQGLASHTTLLASEWILRELPQYGNVLKAKRIDTGTVIIEAANSIAVQECTERSGDLLSYIQSTLPEAKIVSVRVVRA